MNANMLGTLLLETLRRPDAVAARLMGLGIPVQTLWLGLILVTVLNALSFALSNILFPAPSPVPGLTDNPLIYAGVSGVVLLAIVFILTGTGRMLGGTAQLPDMLVLFVWLQFVGLVAQLAILFVTLAIPVFGALLTLIFFAISFWITLHFISAAHRFGSLSKAFGTLILTLVVLIIGTSLLLAIVGVTPEGLTQNV